MVRPRLSFCNQRHINTLDVTAITHLFNGADIDDLHLTTRDRKSAVHYFYNLLKSLNQLRTVLNKYKTREQSNSPITTMSGKIYQLNLSKDKTKQKDADSLIEDSMLANWSQLTDQLTMRPLITTLLPDDYLASLASKFEEFLIHCQTMGITCGLRKNLEWNPWLHSDFFRYVFK